MKLSIMILSSIALLDVSSAQGGVSSAQGGMGMSKDHKGGPLETIPNSMPEAPPLPSSYEYNPSLSKDKWEDFTPDDFYKALQCEETPLGDRSIHDTSTWNRLRQTYEDVVGSGRSSINGANIEGMDHKLNELPLAQDATSIHAESVPNKGRGIVAQRDIKADEHIWSDVYLAKFYDTHDLNRFLAVLPSQLACDVIIWKYDHDENPDDFFFSVNLDVSSFCNDGGSSESNIFWESGPIVKDFFAARDIRAGEEILCDYGYNYIYE